MDDDTQEFLASMERLNRSIAAREAAKKARVEPDLVRLQREEERRAKYGQLRAREKTSKRPRKVRSLFGFTDLSSND